MHINLSSLRLVPFSCPLSDQGPQKPHKASARLIKMHMKTRKPCPGAFVCIHVAKCLTLGISWARNSEPLTMCRVSSARQSPPRHTVLDTILAQKLTSKRCKHTTGTLASLTHAWFTHATQHTTLTEAGLGDTCIVKIKITDNCPFLYTEYRYHVINAVCSFLISSIDKLGPGSVVLREAQWVIL